MYGGEVVETGPTEVVIGEPRHPYTQRLLAAARREVIDDPSDDTAVLDRTAPFQGCRFVGHCPKRIPACTDTRPPRVNLGPLRLARCHLLEAL